MLGIVSCEIRARISQTNSQHEYKRYPNLNKLSKQITKIKFWGQTSPMYTLGENLSTWQSFWMHTPAGLEAGNWDET